ncbi:Hsp70 family protein [Rhodococcus sp. SGAir0479]|uniref:Hsp70 family protein n=1 Tax=Rhodococcus sp. SGAir0479 TaxID=2567884 RepID=UPI0010CD3786|nr:Hsp70 family protein [Rhodococcus sp. SGAir0479]QCQ92538.1 Hsp70 family protein [Rhodococcus sp. SGAir0479]
MAAGLGIAVGTTNSVIAVAPDHASATDETAAVHSRPTALSVPTDGAPVLAGLDVSPTGTRVTGYVERVGDPVGLLDDSGRVHRGEDLFAATVTGLIATVHDEGDDTASADAVVVTHPTAWSAYTVSALESALDRAGVPDARLVPEALACVRWLESARGPQGDGVVVVYDLGGSGLDVTVVRTGAAPSVIGRPLHSEDFAGDSIDHLVTRLVLDGLAGRTADLDPFDAATTAALLDLRRRCTDAKEALSTDTETTLAVALPGLGTDVRLVRSELEDLIREPLTKSLELVREALRAAEIESSDVTAVLLAGGGGAIPLVAELVSSELGLTVVAAPEPARTAALGAARLAADVPAAAAAPAAVATAETVELPRAAAAPVVPAFPTRRHTTRDGSSMRRRVAVVASAAAALAVLTAGGLALGTSSAPPAQSSSPDIGTSTSTTAPTTGGDRPVTEPGTADAVTVGRTGTGTGTGTQAPAVAGAEGGAPAAGAAGTPATPGAPTSDGAPGAPAPAPAAPPATPSGTEPGGGTPPPVYPPSGGGPSAPVYNGPSPSEVGAGMGQVATGIGQGLGGVVTGIGTGVGNVVGAVVDPVTGLLIGQ